MPFHLVYPLFSSFVFVLGMLFAKRAIAAGASPWTGTFWANMWLAVGWLIAGVVHGTWLPIAGWWQAALVGGAFLLGQLFTYLAFQFGDLSVATPVFGVKVIMVALMVAAVDEMPVTARIWVGAALATIGVALVQAQSPNPNRPPAAHPVRTVALVLMAAFALSVFDLGLQRWGPRWGTPKFLPIVFASTGVLSFVILPWTDSPARLHQCRALRPMLGGTVLVALQALSMSYSLSTFGDATRINIVYALRGLWAVVLAWSLSRFVAGGEAGQSRTVMLLRLTGALALLAAVVIALM